MNSSTDSRVSVFQNLYILSSGDIRIQIMYFY